MANIFDFLTNKTTLKGNTNTAGGTPVGINLFGTQTGGAGGTYAPVKTTTTSTSTSDSRSYQNTISSVYSPSVQYILNSSGANMSGATSTSYPSASLTPSSNTSASPTVGVTSEPTTSASGNMGLLSMGLILVTGLGAVYFITKKKK